MLKKLKPVFDFATVPLLMFVWTYAPLFLLVFSRCLHGIKDEVIAQRIMAAFSIASATGMVVLSIWCAAKLKRELKTAIKTRAGAIVITTGVVLLLAVFAPYGSRLVDSLKELHDIGSVSVLAFVGVWLFGLGAFVTVFWDNAVNQLADR
jgi:hypothetical protein